MAEWIPPKIDYWDTPRPVGGEDFKRIEGNTEYLKTQIDQLKQQTYIVRGEIDLDGSQTVYITHNLKTTNVLVNIFQGMGSGFLTYAPTNIHFRILDENRVAIRNGTTAPKSNIVYTIAKMIT